MSSLYQCFLNSTGISLNSKKINNDNIFFGIKGKNFDGSDFAEEAISNGAKLAVICKTKKIKKTKKIFFSNCPQKDLQNLAKIHRASFNIPFIAITGSVGKTTTRELTKKILSTKYRVFSNDKNYNTEIGVSLTVLSIPLDAEIAVIELGARIPGDITFLCEIVKPTHGLITDIAEVHLDTLKSIKGIVKEKTQLFKYLDIHNGVKFINQDINILKNSISNKQNVILYGRQGFSQTIGNSNDIFAEYQDETEKVIKTKLLGFHNIKNIAAARCVGKYFKIENSQINNSIKSFTPYDNRQQIINKNTNTFFLDAYSSNFNSLSKVIDIFSKYQSNKSKFVILGDMGEQGGKTKKYHDIIVSKIQKYNFDKVIFCGNNFWHSQFDKKNNLNTIFFKFKKDLENYLRKNSYENCFFLIKACRLLKFESLLDVLSKTKISQSQK